MTNERPTCHGCSSQAIASLRILPNGKDAAPTTIHACSTHYKAAKDAGRILGQTIYGDPIIKKLD